MRTKQCKACPWRKDVDPHDIPNGYSEALHCGLADTIAEPGAIRFGGALRIMACHESPVGEEMPCVGWLHHQLGPGNNIALRLWARKNLKKRLELVGEQHECFEDTLPEE
jgi:hypothetical protein